MDDRESHEPPPIVQRPPRRVLYRITLAVCAAAVAAESALWVASAGGFDVLDLIRLPLLTSAYLFLALFVWIQRRRAATSGMLLAATVVLAAVGLGVAGAHYARSLTSGPTRARHHGVRAGHLLPVGAALRLRGAGGLRERHCRGRAGSIQAPPRPSAKTSR